MKNHSIAKKAITFIGLIIIAMAISASTIVGLGNELIRINPSNNRIEASSNQGRTWTPRYSGSYFGTFTSLLALNGNLLATTTKGVAASNNAGRSWSFRCTSSSYGEFQSLSAANGELLAVTSKGLYASKDSGRTWVKRR